MWGKKARAPLPLGDAWEKPSISDVEDAEEGPTTSRRSDAQPADTEKTQRLGGILGKPKPYREKDSSSPNRISALGKCVPTFLAS